MAATADTSISTEIPRGTWASDPVHSTATFAVKHMVVATFRGRFDEIHATLVADDGVKLTGTVPADSIVVKDENLAGHLKSPDFFDVERYPDITYVATSLRRDGEELVADGELTIKGVSHRVEARGTITDAAVAIDDSERIGVTLEAIVDRTAYGLDWNAPLPKGGMVLANDVKLTVELELVREQQG